MADESRAKANDRTSRTEAKAEPLVPNTGPAAGRRGLFRRWGWVLAVFWTAAVGGSLWWNLAMVEERTIEAARDDARLALDRDMLHRRWNAAHGGVYVPEDAQTRPNPFLAGLPERDVTTPSGRVLTLINHQAMTLNVDKLAHGQTVAVGHLSSLRPLNPADGPDPWERRALEAFERGTTEVSGIEERDGQSFLRIMRAFRTEETCLRCHAMQGYRVGDVRGGISASVPLKPYRTLEWHRTVSLAVAHAGLLLFGLGGIVLAGRQLGREEKRRHELEDRLRELSLRDALTGLYNRHGFDVLAEQQLRLATRNRKPLAILFVDLDGMKTINDRWGHRDGDQALRDTAGLLRGTMRGSDIIARVGGDEFVVLAVDANGDGAAAAVGRLEQLLVKHNAGSGRPFELSLSIGVGFGDPAAKPCTLAELIEQADRAMYERKRLAGRARETAGGKVV
jgi:diguanylate cyclase (GGDEF)-like protein